VTETPTVVAQPVVLPPSPQRFVQAPVLQQAPRVQVVQAPRAFAQPAPVVYGYGNHMNLIQRPVQYAPVVQNSVNLVDVDGDGIPDIAVQQPVRRFVSAVPQQVNLVDVDGDGIPDIAVQTPAVRRVVDPTLAGRVAETLKRSRQLT